MVYDILKQMQFLEIILYFLICFHCIIVGYRVYYFSVYNRSVVQAIKNNIFCNNRYVQDFSYRGEFFIQSNCSLIGNYRRYHKRKVQKIQNKRNEKRITVPKEKQYTDSPKPKPFEDSRKIVKEKVEKQQETTTLPSSSSHIVNSSSSSHLVNSSSSSHIVNSSSTKSFHQPSNSSFFPWDDGIDYGDVCNKLLNILRSFDGPMIINSGKHGGLGHKFISLYYTITYALVLQRPLYSIILSLFLISS